MKLRDTAPEGLIPWIREQKDIAWKNYLIYKHDWYREPITGLRKPCAKAVCSAIRQAVKLAEADPASQLSALLEEAGSGEAGRV